MWSENGEPKTTPRSQTKALEGDSVPGCVVRAVEWKRKFLSIILTANEPVVHVVQPAFNRHTSPTRHLQKLLYREASTTLLTLFHQARIPVGAVADSCVRTTR